MSLIIAKITLRNIPNKRMARKAMKTAWHKIAGFWHRNYRPLHFLQSASRRYGYRRRTDKYNRAKLREHGHTIPLVWSGTTKALAAVRDIRSTSQSGKARIYGRALNLRPRGWPHKLGDEVKLTTVRERRVLAKVFVRHFERRMNELQKG